MEWTNGDKACLTALSSCHGNFHPCDVWQSCPSGPVGDWRVQSKAAPSSSWWYWRWAARVRLRWGRGRPRRKAEPCFPESCRTLHRPPGLWPVDRAQGSARPGNPAGRLSPYTQRRRIWRCTAARGRWTSQSGGHGGPGDSRRRSPGCSRHLPRRLRNGEEVLAVKGNISALLSHIQIILVLPASVCCSPFFPVWHHPLSYGYRALATSPHTVSSLQGHRAA